MPRYGSRKISLNHKSTLQNLEFSFLPTGLSDLGLRSLASQGFSVVPHTIRRLIKNAGTGYDDMITTIRDAINDNQDINISQV